MKSALLLILTLAIAQPLSALTIRTDYTYDTGNFFDSQAKKDAIEAVAKFYGDLIQDNLLQINTAEFPGCSWNARPTQPSTGSVIDIPNLVVPANTIIVYVGALELGGTTAGNAGPGGWSASSNTTNWPNRLRGRGSSSAAIESATSKTDFAPWGGSISFDTPRTWNFSLTQNLAGTDFIPIALHEMGHVLGIGTADSWKNKISSNLLNGSAAIRSFGSAPGTQTDKGHFGGNVTTSKSFGGFSVVHGTTRQVLMLPTLTDDNTNLIVASDLDLAGLVDIGWQLMPPANVDVIALSPVSASFSWKSSSFFDYRLQRGTDLVSFPGGNASAQGSGGIQSWVDPSPWPGRAFYRLAATSAITPPAAIPTPMALSTGETQSSSWSEPPRIVTGCGGHP